MSLQKIVRQEELVTGNKRVVPAFSNVCVCVCECLQTTQSQQSATPSRAHLNHYESNFSEFCMLSATAK